jgi:hypothetical protein
VQETEVQKKGSTYKRMHVEDGMYKRTSVHTVHWMGEGEVCARGRV